MTDLLTRDANHMHRALDSADEDVLVQMSRETLEWVTRITDARIRGQQVIITSGKREVSPSEAAILLAMSRGQIRKLMEAGELVSRMVGTHHRITADSVEAFAEREHQHMSAGMEKLAELQNELGLDD